MPWTPVAASSGAWVPLPGDRDDWIDPRTTLLLTEDGASLRMENDGFLTAEAVSTIPSPWVPL